VDQINPDDQCCFDEAVGRLSFRFEVCPKSAMKKLESTTLIVNTDNNESLILGGEEWPDWAKDRAMQSGLDVQQIANSAPHDAILVDPFQPGWNEGFSPHPLAPLLVPVIYAHNRTHGVPRAGGFGRQAGSSSSADLEGLDMEVDMQTAGSSCLNLMK
jgi:hypothetical protein